MQTRRSLLVAVAGSASAGCAVRQPMVNPADAVQAVRAAETGFAATMARRDLTAFASFIAEDAVFIKGGTPLRGRAAIVAFWTRFFAPGAAPFSWRPELVEIAGGGLLGYTEGPVMDPEGKIFAKFFSTWRRAESGRYEVVFDNGQSVCKPCAP